MNPFSSRDAARLYAAGRPFYHPIIADHLRNFLPPDFKAVRALDVACGTGLSTRILLEFAEEVVGCDASAAMLELAFMDDRIRYVRAPAEALPFPDGVFDLLTLGSSLHWLDRPTALAEITRVLSLNGKLVIYDHGFTGEMAGIPAFASWHTARYLARYPAPPRDARPLQPADAAPFGLQLLRQASFSHLRPLNCDELIAYLLTQSNLAARLETGSLTETEATTWLKDELSPFFTSAQETFWFTGTIGYWSK